MGTNRAFVTGTAPAPPTASALAPAGTVACLTGPRDAFGPALGTGVGGLVIVPILFVRGMGLPDGRTVNRHFGAVRPARRSCAIAATSPAAPAAPAAFACDRLFRRGRGFVPGFCVVVLKFFVRLDGILDVFNHRQNERLLGRGGSPDAFVRCPLPDTFHLERSREHVRPRLKGNRDRVFMFHARDLAALLVQRIDRNIDWHVHGQSRCALALSFLVQRPQYAQRRRLDRPYNALSATRRAGDGRARDDARAQALA
jgi:hypothetical protein